MHRVIEWVKSHLHIVICSALAAGSITFLVLGILNSSVADAMQSAASQVSALRSQQAVNKAIIAASRETLQQTEERVNRILSSVQEVGAHAPVLPNVFPEPENRATAFHFKSAYEAEFPKLLTKLRAKDQPSSDEITRMREQIASEKMRIERQRSLGGENVPPPTDSPSAIDLSDMRRDRGRRTLSSFGGEIPKDMTREEWVEQDAAARASVARAYEIFCYADEQSFYISPAVVDANMPELSDMWFAQMTLWIQQDMVDALAGLNNRVVQQHEADGKTPWVGNLPVKHVKSILVGGYEDAGSESSSSRGRRGSDRSSGSTESFTERTATKAVDVIRLQLVLVVEAASLPTVIDSICRSGFYTPTLVSYQSVPVNPNLQGYIYGPAPAIEVVLDYEGAFLREKYEQWMPEVAAEMIESGKASEAMGNLTSGSSRSGSGGSDLFRLR